MDCGVGCEIFEETLRGKSVSADLNVNTTKMKRGLSEMLSFYSKKTAFHSGVSLHFRGKNKCYGFSRNRPKYFYQYTFEHFLH